MSSKCVCECVLIKDCEPGRKGKLQFITTAASTFAFAEVAAFISETRGHCSVKCSKEIK